MRSTGKSVRAAAAVSVLCLCATISSHQNVPPLLHPLSLIQLAPPRTATPHFGTAAPRRRPAIEPTRTTPQPRIATVLPTSSGVRNAERRPFAEPPQIKPPVILSPDSSGRRTSFPLSSDTPPPTPPTHAQTLPFVFEQNLGQAPADVRYLAHSAGAIYVLTDDAIRIAPRTGSNITLQFVHVQTSTTDGPHKKKRSSSHRSRKSKRGSSKRGSSHSGSSTRSRHPKNATASEPAEQHASLNWHGAAPLAAETNYFLGRDPSQRHAHVKNFAEVSAQNVAPGIDLSIYGTQSGAEYDLRIAPHTDPANIRLKLTAAWRLDENGNLTVREHASTFVMHAPVAYELTAAHKRKTLPSRYILHADNTVSFRVTGRDPKAELVIDPSLSVSYFSFLGGQGTDSAASVTVDANGFVYVGGTTTARFTVPNAITPPNISGPTGGASDFFVAKIDPTKSGAASLIYLTFIGGSAAETGGQIAIYQNPTTLLFNLVVVGTTTSYDYPVTDGSTLTASAGATPVNDVAITELDPTGAKILYSTLFGGNGNEATQSSGGVAIPTAGLYAGKIFVAMDTTSTNLPFAPTITTNTDGTTSGGPFQTTYGGGASDGFLVILDPSVASGTSAVLYCTYLGIFGQATVSGIAVDSESNAYLAGSTTDPQNSQGFTALNNFQQNYGGGDSDAFVMKISPSGTGASDLSYGTLLGGSGTDQAFAIAVSTSLPGTAYVAGTTQSKDFPVNGAVASFQPKLATGATANAFLAVIAQNPTNYATSLSYSTYLGGTQTDAAQSVWLAAQNQVYLAGTTTSWNFPWLSNLQPLNGQSDAFVAELDPTTAGTASLLYATPLAGSVSSGATTTHGNAVAVHQNAYVVGDTNESDFPLTVTAAQWFPIPLRQLLAVTVALRRFRRWHRPVRESDRQHLIYRW